MFELGGRAIDSSTRLSFLLIVPPIVLVLVLVLEIPHRRLYKLTTTRQLSVPFRIPILWESSDQVFSFKTRRERPSMLARHRCQFRETPDRVSGSRVAFRGVMS